MKTFCPFASAVVLIFALCMTAAHAAEKNNARGCKAAFSSVYTDLKDDCPASKPEGDDGDPTHTCKSVGPYHAYIYYSALGTHVQIDEGEKTVLRLPEQGHDETLKRKLEWRLADGKPFAVIYRVAQYTEKGLEQVGGSYMQDEHKKGELIVVRGLKEHSGLKEDMNPAKIKMANEKAQKFIDEGFCKLQK